ncbi:MAG TPA: DegT/DnrJ/EryC1/StrS family aminotransferase, partial [Bryobacteraceae bacterium]|nr:DegT/DnrJ/EryC1/StrS family aminotransferase [Bryobacteraceae bacterium]
RADRRIVTMDRRKMMYGLAAAGSLIRPRCARGDAAKPALLGGAPVREAPFPSWPIVDDLADQSLLKVLHSGKWNRGMGVQVSRFEQDYAQFMGAKHCLAAANGTSALVIALHALGVQAGDEVIVPPYTFVATINAVLAMHALPVFVDSDPRTFQIDARKIESAFTDRTVAIVPVHLGGNVADLDVITAAAAKRNIPVLEDACQAHLAEWKKKKVGTYGTFGCFSFQASKNLNSGEGGAILTDDSGLIEKCYSFHNNGRGRSTPGYDFSYKARGLNLRLTEFQGALLMAQMTRLAKQTETREKNGAYLSKQLHEIPGINPAEHHSGTTRNAYHLYMFRYDPVRFAGLPRAKFLKALQAEGIPASSGYSPLNKEPLIEESLSSRGFRRVFDEKTLGEWRQRNECPANDRLCAEAVWFTQTMLLGPRSDMDGIASAIRKIQANAAEIARS